jgi:hypothetical protein
MGTVHSANLKINIRKVFLSNKERWSCEFAVLIFYYHLRAFRKCGNLKFAICGPYIVVQFANLRFADPVIFADLKLPPIRKYIIFLLTNLSFYATLPYIRHFIFADCYDNNHLYLVINLAGHLELAGHLDLAGFYFSKCPANSKCPAKFVILLVMEETQVYIYCICLGLNTRNPG